MNAKKPFSDHHIESLVRSYLEEEGRHVDTQKLLAKICLRLAEGAEADAPVRRVAPASRRTPLLRWPRRFGLGFAVCLVIAVGIAWYVIPIAVPPNAYAIVSEARSVLAKRADRCYQVECTATKNWLRNNSLIKVEGETRLWTRGDRFRLETGKDGERFTWGQDDQGRVWLVNRENQGLVFERGEVPPVLAGARSFLRVDGGRLMNQMLHDFDLQIESLGGKGADANMAVIRASAKPGREKKMACNAARLDINMSTKLIKRMELSHSQAGGVQWTYIFTFVEKGTQPDTTYRVDGNVPTGAAIIGKEHAGERAQLLQQLIKERRLD
jgi:hypothetical protein